MMNLLDRSELTVAADSLVLATTNQAQDELWRDLQAEGVNAVNIGDSQAPRLAPFVIYEGRVAGMSV